MPRNTREWSRRELEAARNNINWVGKHLHAVYEVYNVDHPEISEPIYQVQLVLLELDKVIDKIRSSY